MEQKPSGATFITGNENKLKEFNDIMSSLGLQFTNKSLSLPEFQGEPEFIAKEKVKLAAIEINGPAIVEDVSLCFNALKGLPGPYIKDFLEKLGPEGLY